MKNVLILVLLGALLGVIAASYIVPGALTWYAEPGGLPQGTPVQSLVQVPEVIRYATSKLLRSQTIGGVIGAAAGLGLGIVLLRRGRQRVEAGTPNPSVKAPR